jgi:hypothetical protein
MALNNEISNRIAGWAWLAVGGFGVAWLSGWNRWLSSEQGVLRSFLAKTGSQEERNVLTQVGRIFGFFAAWLILYLILDWLF